MNEKDKKYPVDRQAIHAEIRKGLKTLLPKDAQPIPDPERQDSKEPE